jgi:hypothetical protein
VFDKFLSAQKGRSFQELKPVFFQTLNGTGKKAGEKVINSTKS